MANGISIKKNAVEDWIKKLKSKEAAKNTYLKQNIYPLYQKAQMERWQTRGESQNTPFPPVTNAVYKARKRVKFSDYPGGGNKDWIRTATLVSAAIGKGGNNIIDPKASKKYHRMKIQNGGMVIAVEASSSPKDESYYMYMIWKEKFNYMSFEIKTIKAWQKDFKSWWGKK